MKHLERIIILAVIVMQIALMHEIDNLSDKIEAQNNIIWNLRLDMCEMYECM